jgi:hypothetical protein
MRDDAAATKRLAWALAAAYVLLTIAWRLGQRLADLGPDLQYVWSIAPVGALGLFVGVRLRSPWAVLFVPGAMLVSDLLLIAPLSALHYSSFSWATPIIYVSLAMYAVVGLAVRKGASPLWIAGAGLAGGFQFYLVTNFTSWLGIDGVSYPRTLAGLIDCYVQALPFYRNTVVGDALFSCLFFGVYAVAVAVQREKASQPA